MYFSALERAVSAWYTISKSDFEFERVWPVAAGDWSISLVCIVTRVSARPALTFQLSQSLSLSLSAFYLLFL